MAPITLRLSCSTMYKYKGLYLYLQETNSPSFIQKLSCQKCADYNILTPSLSTATALPTSRIQVWLTGFSESLHKCYCTYIPTAPPLKTHLSPFLPIKYALILLDVQAPKTHFFYPTSSNHSWNTP